jgi:hypothetical protein
MVRLTALVLRYTYIACLVLNIILQVYFVCGDYVFITLQTLLTVIVNRASAVSGYEPKYSQTRNSEPCLEPGSGHSSMGIMVGRTTEIWF